LRAIFVSYRRSDAEGEAGRLFDDLVKPFGENTVFMDVSTIEAGRDFRQAIDESIANCGVVLAVIGPEWLDASNEAGVRRLDDPADFVRIETASALRRDIPVIPVLVRGAKMPRVDQLPEELNDLAYRNCVELTHARWRSDIQLLIKALRPLVGDLKPGASWNHSDESVADQPGATKLPESDGGNSASVWAEPETLERLSNQLARYIGPIAEIVVKRTALNCTSVEDLCRKVAQEIESQADREKFLASIRG
jgi:hypothetical protein